MKVLLIRHGKTYGNTMQRYIGVTDEPILKEEEKRLSEKRYPAAERIFVSPKRRCRQTGNCLYPGKEQICMDQLAECDFGLFENKNWKELKDCQEYQAWIDSGGKMAFPGGEDPEAFRDRCCLGFECAVNNCIVNGEDRVVFVVHGGTIMSILERYGRPKREFYDWNVKNGEGYEGTLEVDDWKQGNRRITELTLLDGNGGRI